MKEESILNNLLSQACTRSNGKNFCEDEAVTTPGRAKLLLLTCNGGSRRGQRRKTATAATNSIATATHSIFDGHRDTARRGGEDSGAWTRKEKKKAPWWPAADSWRNQEKASGADDGNGSTAQAEAPRRNRSQQMQQRWPSVMLMVKR